MSLFFSLHFFHFNLLNKSKFNANDCSMCMKTKSGACNSAKFFASNVLRRWIGVRESNCVFRLPFFSANRFAISFIFRFNFNRCFGNTASILINLQSYFQIIIIVVQPIRFSLDLLVHRDNCFKCNTHTIPVELWAIYNSEEWLR